MRSSVCWRKLPPTPRRSPFLSRRLLHFRCLGCSWRSQRCRSTGSLVADRRIFRAFPIALSAARASRAPARRGAPRNRPSCRHGAVLHPRHCAQKERSGILIFVSLAEHYARIIADDGIAAHVPQSEWQGAIDALIAHMSGGRIIDGFITAIEKCGHVLAINFPRSKTSHDELPDRIYLI